MKKYSFNSILAFLASLFILVACQNGSQGTSKVFIQGEYFPFEEKVYISRVTSNNVEILDSVDITQGRPFEISIDAPEKSVFRLAHKELYPLMVIAENGDSVFVTQTADAAWPYKLRGGSDCMLLANYLERLNRDHAKIDSLSEVFHRSQEQADFVSVRDRLNDEFIRIHESHKEYARSIITSSPSSIVSIIIINGFFKEFALFDQHEDFEYYEIVDNALMSRIPENKYAIDFHSQVENIRAAKEYELEQKMRLSRGRLVPEFSLPGTSGTTVGPQDMIGHNLLIYFWASTDAPSRQANKIVKRVYEAYSKIGFKLLAISFDKNPSYWEAAIELDSLPGVHANDLKGAGSPLHKLFNIKMQLPNYFLIDTQGRIFDHSRDFGKLPEKIVELYSMEPDV